MKKTLTILATTVAMMSGNAVIAQDFSAELKARQGQFRILAINLGILGAMAKGEAPYDAEEAQNAADSLVAVSMIHEPPLWPQGSDDMGIEGTRALPAIWDNFDDFLSKWDDLGTAALTVQAAAGNGQAAIGPVLGEIGGTCKACHDDYRAPDN